MNRNWKKMSERMHAPRGFVAEFSLFADHVFMVVLGTASGMSFLEMEYTVFKKFCFTFEREDLFKYVSWYKFLLSQPIVLEQQPLFPMPDGIYGEWQEKQANMPQHFEVKEITGTLEFAESPR